MVRRLAEEIGQRIPYETDEEANSVIDTALDSSLDVSAVYICSCVCVYSCLFAHNCQCVYSCLCVHSYMCATAVCHLRDDVATTGWWVGRGTCHIFNDSFLSYHHGRHQEIFQGGARFSAKKSLISFFAQKGEKRQFAQFFGFSDEI